VNPILLPARAPDPISEAPAGGARVRPRLDAIDQLRGLVMVLMALDHTRDFFTDVRFDPLDLTRTNSALFLTRWVTHFCAPTFVFLAGTGAFLYGARGKTPWQQAWFLLTRGLWLVFLEFTLVDFGWTFAFDLHHRIGQVIWAIGWSMVGLSGLVFLPGWAVGLVGVVVIAGHNCLDDKSAEAVRLPAWLWQALKAGKDIDFSTVPWARPLLVQLNTWSGNKFDLAKGLHVIVAYPVLPWLGVMALGYGFGAVWLLEPRRRRRLLAAAGAAFLLLFVVLRYANVYGDPRPWQWRGDLWFTCLSFVDCCKYPPSLLYVLMTLGPALLALAYMDGREPRPPERPLVVFGRVPLFFYLLHVPLIHALAIGLAYFGDGDASALLGHPIFFPAGYGYGLPVVYLIWLAVVAVLYPPCRWFADVKRRRSDAWLSYF
jgi:uncharacterized membrane protein